MKRLIADPPPRWLLYGAFLLILAALAAACLLAGLVAGSEVAP